MRAKFSLNADASPRLRAVRSVPGSLFRQASLASVTHIFLASTRGAPMASVALVEALTDGGLSGDRYADSKNRRAPDYQVTLIEMENIEAFVANTGLALSSEQPRRNIVTRGINLNSLCGKRFRVGGATFEGLELCEPCSLFAKRTHREILKFFIGKGGLRARIIQGGDIHVGDRVSEDAQPLAQPGRLAAGGAARRPSSRRLASFARRLSRTRKRTT
jgi:MOSC domain-containing protein YiiM